MERNGQWRATLRQEHNEREKGVFQAQKMEEHVVVVGSSAVCQFLNLKKRSLDDESSLKLRCTM